MLYYASIQKIKPNDYDGYIVFKVNKELLSFYYQAPIEFADEYLLVGRSIVIDIWIELVSEIKELPDFSPYVPFGQYPADGDASGSVHSILGPEQFRLDCGKLTFDVYLGRPVQFAPGTNLWVRGCRHVFFPNTEWSYESTGCV